MRRRRFLDALMASLAVGTAGCLASAPESGSASTPDETATPQTGTGSTPTPTAGSTGSDTAAIRGTELPVPLSAMRQPLPRDYIPALIDTAFAADWSGLDAGERDPTLPGDAPVLGLERDGRARAYPLRILNHHEVVNDTFAGPIAVTYCVLCGSGVAFERRVAGEPTQFGVSGKLWRSDLVLYDGLTDSLWSQLAATAIRGPRTGDRLTLLPTTLTTWAEWQRSHPGTRVLLPPPRSKTVGQYDREFDYFSAKYGYAEEAQLVGRDSYDGDLHPKTMVIGVRAGGSARAYPFQVVTEEGVINDRVGGLPVVVAAVTDGTLVAYDRRADGRTLQFRAAGDRHLAADGSRWTRSTGRAVDGPHQKRRLDRANDHPPMFWTGWSAFNPATDVYGRDRPTD